MDHTQVSQSSHCILAVFFKSIPLRHSKITYFTNVSVIFVSDNDQNLSKISCYRVRDYQATRVFGEGGEGLAFRGIALRELLS